MALWLADKPADEPVWPGKWAKGRHGAEMIRIDQTAADVEYEDDRGRVADFHALRHTFISNLARAGVHPRNAQALARHSTIDLTMNVYTHVSVKDLAKDVEGLPAVGRTTVPAPALSEPSAADSPAIPQDLAALLGRWESLPENIRNAISTLAGA